MRCIVEIGPEDSVTLAGQRVEFSVRDHELLPPPDGDGDSGPWLSEVLRTRLASALANKTIKLVL